jgi:ABC-type transport system involved in cytochrome c biogenesis permease component
MTGFAALLVRDMRIAVRVGGGAPFGPPFTILCALSLASLVVGPFAAAAALRYGLE